MDNNKIPAKKPRRVATNYNGTKYEDTGFMVCSICIRPFRMVENYNLHMERHRNNLDFNSISIMKVFKEMPETNVNADDPELHYAIGQEGQEPDHTQTMGTSKSVPMPSGSIGVLEKFRNSYSMAEAIVKFGKAETFGVGINKQRNNTFAISVDKFRRAITNISNNIRDQLIRRILQSPYFTLHFDDFLDIKNFTTLIVTVRYKHETHIQNEILYCQRLAGTNANEIYLIATKFMRDYNLNWEYCVGISMDKIRGNDQPLNSFMELIFNSGLAPTLTYTFSRRADFIAQQLPDVLAETLRDAIAILNILKRNMSLKFELDMDDEYQQILYHTDKYWLSYGRLLSRLLEMRDQCKDIPEVAKFKDKLCSINWLHKLAYLADLFAGFRRFNRDLQDDQFSIFHICDQISARINFLEMYKRNVEKNDFSNFPTLQRLLTANVLERHINRDILDAIVENLRCLQNRMNGYLPTPRSEIKNYSWIRNPFDVNPDEMPSNFSMDEQEMLRILKVDCFMKTKFEEKLDYFWSFADDNYPDLATKAMKYLLIFTNSQLSELAFASLIDIRTSSLTDLEHEESYLLIKLSNIQPDLMTLPAIS